METPFRTNWLLVFALLVAGLFAAAQFGKLTLTLTQLRDVYPNGGGFVPGLISIVGMVGIALGAVAGVVVARLGVARALVGALFAGAVLSLLQASLPGIAIFAVLRVLEGLSHLVIVVAAPTLIASVSTEEDRPLAMGIWAAFFGISMAIIAAGLPYLLPIGGLPAVLIVHGMGMAVIAVILMPLLPKEAPDQTRLVSYFEEHRVIYTSPQLLIPGAGFVWYTIIYIALLAVLPLAFEVSVWLLTALPLISILGTLAGGVIAKRMLPSSLVTLGFVLTIVACALVWTFAGEVWTLFVLFAVMALIPAGSFAAIPHYNHSTIDRARATGGLAQLGNVGTTLGTPILVVAYEGAGFGIVILLIAGFCTFGIVANQALRAQIK